MVEEELSAFAAACCASSSTDDEDDRPAYARLTSQQHPNWARDYCGRCGRPASRPCLCAALPREPLALRTHVTVVQHAREARKGINTVALLRPLLGPSLEVFQANFNEALPPALLPAGAVLLYPAPDAMAVDTAAGAARLRALVDSGERVTLVVLDGTWRQAKRLYREFGAALQRLPAVCLEAPRDDRIYHAIRREPGAAQLSTFESVAAVLASLEGDPSLFSTLIAPLSLFVAQQVGERDAAAARGNLKALNARRRAAADG